MVLYLSGNGSLHISAMKEWAVSTVLLIGEDDLLLQTRAAVLRTTGARTVCSNGRYASVGYSAHSTIH